MSTLNTSPLIPTLTRPGMFRSALLLFGISLQLAGAAPYFTETFNSFSPGTNITTTPNLTAYLVNGSATAYQDNGGNGTTPSVTLFPGAGVATFANVNNSKLGTLEGVTGTYDIVFRASLRNAEPLNPFSGAPFLQLEWRQSALGALDGLLARIYDNGNIDLFSGNFNFLTFTSGTGIGNTDPFDLKLTDTGSEVSFFANGSVTPFLSYTTSFGASNAGFIAFGNENFTGVKVDSVSVVPEPGAFAQMVVGVVLLFLLTRFRKSNA